MQVLGIGSSVTNLLDGSTCYRFRCSMLHQGTSQIPKSAFARILFVEPGTTTNTFHYMVLNDALLIDLGMFCEEIIAGVRLWLAKVEATPLYQANYAMFAARHPGGLPPYITGVPVIG